MSDIMSCTFCYKVCGNNTSNNEACHRFFELFSRYSENYNLESYPGSGELSQNNVLQLFKAVNAMVGCCDDCSKLLHSFCDLYHELQCCELRIAWTLGKLTNVVSSADKVASRIDRWKEFVEETAGREGGKEEVLRRVRVLRTRLVENGHRRCKMSFPKVKLRRHSTVQFTAESPTIEDKIDTKQVLELEEAEAITLLNEPGSALSNQGEQVLDRLRNFEEASTNVDPEIDSYSIPSSDSIDQPAEAVVGAVVEEEAETSQGNILTRLNRDANDKSAYDTPISDFGPPEDDDFRDDAEDVTPDILPPIKNEPSDITEMPDCNVGNFNNGSCRRLLRSVHRCTKCGKTFSSSQQLDKHVEVAHNQGEDTEDSSSTSSDSEDSENAFDTDTESDLSDHSGDSNPINVKRKVVPYSQDFKQLRSEAHNIILTPDGLTLDDFTQGWTDLRKHNCEGPGNCREKFMTPKELDHHSKLHGSFTCGFCSVVKDYAPDLAFHELDHIQAPAGQEGPKGLLSKVRYKCPRCPYSNKYQKLYIHHHLKTHLGSLLWGTLMCPVCDKMFVSKTEGRVRHVFLRHYQMCHYENGPPAVLCDECGTEFKEGYLEQHKRREHYPNPKQFPVRCTNIEPRCYKWFGTKADLQRHLERGHTENTSSLQTEKPSKMTLQDDISCEDCEATFSEHDKFLFHKSLHDNDAKYKTRLKHRRRTLRRLRFSRKAKIIQESSEITALEHYAAGNHRMAYQHRCPITGCEGRGKFVLKEELERHSKMHGEWTCAECQFRTNFAPDLAIHELQHHQIPESISDKKPLYNCRRCSFVTNTEASYLKHHLKDHLGVELLPVHCPVCRLAFSAGILPTRTRRTLLIHFRDFHDISRIPTSAIQRCLSCPAYFSTFSRLRTHRLVAHQEKIRVFNIKCFDCDKVFTTRMQLRRHRIHAHKINPAFHFEFECSKNECGMRFETQKDVDSHLKNFHKYDDSETNSKVCDKCGKSFSSAFGLKKHCALMHGKDKPKVPNRKREDLSRKLVCEKCGKGFRVKDHLTVHSLTHSGPESWEFECELCGKKCMTKQKLNEHLRTHSKEKPFVCQHCGEKYAHAHNLRNHVNSKHPKMGKITPRPFDKTNLTSRKGVKLKSGTPRKK